MAYTATDVKKRLTDFGKRFGKDMDDFNHLYHVMDLLDQVEQDLSYMEDKLEMRKQKVVDTQAEEVKAVKKKVAKKKAVKVETE